MPALNQARSTVAGSLTSLPVSSRKPSIPSAHGAISQFPLRCRNGQASSASAPKRVRWSSGAVNRPVPANSRDNWTAPLVLGLASRSNVTDSAAPVAKPAVSTTVPSTLKPTSSSSRGAAPGRGGGGGCAITVGGAGTVTVGFATGGATTGGCGGCASGSNDNATVKESASTTSLQVAPSTLRAAVSPWFT